MDRRAFLRGTLKSVAAGALVVQATDAEIAAFGKPGDAVAMGIGGDLKVDWSPLNEGIGTIVYNHRGTPIGVLTSYNVKTQTHEVSSWHETDTKTAKGAVTVEYIVLAQGVFDATMKRK